jgi:hypothetical protein
VLFRVLYFVFDDSTVFVCFIVVVSFSYYVIDTIECLIFIYLPPDLLSL